MTTITDTVQFELPSAFAGADLEDFTYPPLRVAEYDTGWGQVCEVYTNVPGIGEVTVHSGMVADPADVREAVADFNADLRVSWVFLLRGFFAAQREDIASHQAGLDARTAIIDSMASNIRGVER